MLPVAVMDAVEYFEVFGLHSGRLGRDDEYYVKILVEHVKKEIE